MRLAIVRLSAMGDIIHAMVAIQYIKKYFPDISIDWIVEETFAELLKYNPHIDNILTVNLKSIKEKKWNLVKQIKTVRHYSKKNYDIVIDAQGLLKSAILSRLISSKVTGFAKNAIREKVASYFYTEKIEIAYHENTIIRNTTVILDPLNIAIQREDILGKEAFLFYSEKPDLNYLISKNKKNIIFIIGSTWESRNYPKEKFAWIANAFKENILIAWGNNEEKEKAFWIEENSDYATALPAVDLNSLKYIIAKMDLLIGNDTGPTHMAWGLNIPSITIFGPTPTNRVCETDINKTIKSHTVVDHYKLNKNDYSIRDINPKEILSIAKDLLY